MANKRLYLAISEEGNELISNDAFALLIGMVLDQQFPLERAFNGPVVLKERLGGTLTAEQIANYDTEELVTLACRVPAIHRFPAANARRIQALAELIIAEYDGVAENIWKTAKTGDQLLKRVESLPGFGKHKARVFVALLGKQLGVRPNGWREACEPFGEPKTTMSVADITSPASLLTVRAYKSAKKAAAKAAKAALE